MLALTCSWAGGSDGSGLTFDSADEVGCCWHGGEMISDWETSSVICCRHRLQMASSRRKFKNINIRQRKISFSEINIFLLICVAFRMEKGIK